MPKLFEKVPAKACHLEGGGVTISESDDKGNIPIRMLARTSQPIEHWFWGNIVHDLSGFKIHKDRIPVDYCHGEEIGYLDKFEEDPAGLFVHGELVPTGEPGDLVSKLAARSSGGVPYEASISFAGEGLVLEAVDDGESVEVNGYQFSGPGVVVREWPLRGVAICPYGADMNTNSQFTETGDISVKQFRKADMAKEETKELSEETTDAVETEVETTETESTEVETPEVETSETPETDETELSDDRKEAKRFVDAFGDRGAVWFAEGLSFEDARTRETKELREANESLTKELSGLKTKLSLPGNEGESEAVELTSKHDGEKSKKGFAAKINIK